MIGRKNPIQYLLGIIRIMSILRNTQYVLLLATSVLICGCAHTGGAYNPYPGWGLIATESEFDLKGYPNHPPKAIRDDYKSFMQSKGILYPTRILFFKDVTGHGDTTGQHAIFIDQEGVRQNFIGRPVDIGYFLIYDKDNVRIKVKKYKRAV